MYSYQDMFVVRLVLFGQVIFKQTGWLHIPENKTDKSLHSLFFYWLTLSYNDIVERSQVNIFLRVDRIEAKRPFYLKHVKFY